MELAIRESVHPEIRPSFRKHGRTRLFGYRLMTNPDFTCFVTLTRLLESRPVYCVSFLSAGLAGPAKLSAGNSWSSRDTALRWRKSPSYKGSEVGAETIASPYRTG